MFGFHIIYVNGYFLFMASDTKFLFIIVEFRFNAFLTFILFILRESTSGGGLERGRERENPKQALRCQHGAGCRGSNSLM